MTRSIFQALSRAKLCTRMTLFCLALCATGMVNAVVVNGGSDQLRGTFLYDFDSGVQTTDEQLYDVWWQQVDSDNRSLVPRNDAQLYSFAPGTPFEFITEDDLLSLDYSNGNLIGPRSNSPGGPLAVGRVFAVLTNEGQYSKVRVTGYNDGGITEFYVMEFDYVTYDGNGAIESGLVDGSFEDNDTGSVVAPWLAGGTTPTRVDTTTADAEAERFNELGLPGPYPTDGDQMARVGAAFPNFREFSPNNSELSQAFVSFADTLTFDLQLVCLGLDPYTECGFGVVLEELTDSGPILVEADVDGLFVDFASPNSCDQLPCNFTSSGGMHADPVNVRLTGVPVDVAVRLTFIATGQGFAYVDNVRNESLFEPVINYLPGPDPRGRDAETLAEIALPPGGDPVEGDLVVLDCTFSEGVSDAALDGCAWTASSSTFGTMSAEGRYAMMMFPLNGFVDVTLTITEDDTSVSTSTTINVQNAAPLVNALHVEVGADGVGEAVCRFADPGVDPDPEATPPHTISFEFNNAEPMGDMIVQLEDDPSFTSGFATQRFIAEGAAGGTCSVNDGIATTVEDFDITMLTDATLATRRLTKTDTVTTAVDVVSGQKVIGIPDAPSDIDLFRLLPEGTSPDDNLPVGAEFVVSLDVPSDYDLLILTRTITAQSDNPFENAPFVSAPFVSLPFVSVPFVSVPFVSLPFVSLPFVSAPFVSLPFVSVPFVSAPFVSLPFVDQPLTISPYVNANLDFEQLPLSQVGLAAPDGSTISGGDVGLDELGGGNLGALLASGLQATTFSAASGTARETVLVKVSPGTEAMYAAVLPNSGSIAAAHYSLQVEASVPAKQAQLLGARCDGEELVTAGQTSALEVLSAPPTGDARTLIVTQRERMMAVHDMTEAQFSQFIADLTPFFNHPEVMAEVISVPSDDFIDGDLAPCDIEVQNLVTDRVRDHVMNRLEGRPFRYVQIMGGLDVIGARYSPDETSVGYEGLFASDLLIDPATPLAVAITEGNNITDAVYGDLDFATTSPLPYRGRVLYIEDLPVGRMVETPADILDAANAFVATNGIIPVTGGVTSGYDFFLDGTENTAAVLRTILRPSTDPGTLPEDAQVEELINDNWTGDDLRCAFTPDSADAPLFCPAERPSLAAVNFHASYNGALSAFGFSQLNGGTDPAEVLRAGEASQALEQGLTMTIGCHGGMSVPNGWGFSDALGLPISAAEDWVEQPGNWIGSWLFALGDDTRADRGTEGIATLIAEEMVTNRKTIGQALIDAKRRYAAGLAEFDVHDEKSIIGLGLFGMPQARLDIPNQPPAPEPVPLPGTVDIPEQLALQFGDSSGSTVQTEIFDYDLVLPPNGLGTYFPLNGEAQSIVGRPLLPAARVVDHVPLPAGQPRTHDVLILGGTFEDLLNVDPVHSTPRHDWAVNVPEPNPCVETFSPSQLGIATSVTQNVPESTTGTLFESVIIIGAQFKCTLTDAQAADPQQPVLGTLRRYESLNAESQRPVSTSPILAADFSPPVVTEQRLEVNPANGDVLATLDVADTNGMQRIVALIYRDLGGNQGFLESVDTMDNGPLSGPGPFQMILPNAAGAPVSFQYVDNAGNVLLKSGKGQLLAPLAVNIVSDSVPAGPGATLLVDFPGAADVADAELNISFGDGTFGNTFLFDANGQPASNVQLDADGNARVTLTHDYTGVTDPNINVSVTARGNGSEGFTSSSIIVVPLGPDAVDDLVGRAKSTKVNLVWSAVDDADNYRVFRRLNTETSFTDVGTVAHTVFVDYVPRGTTSAEYYVVTENASGASGPSNTVTVSTGGRRSR